MTSDGSMWTSYHSDNLDRLVIPDPGCFLQGSNQENDYDVNYKFFVNHTLEDGNDKSRLLENYSTDLLTKVFMSFKILILI